jgi:hypothetical protein
MFSKDLLQNMDSSDRVQQKGYYSRFGSANKRPPKKMATFKDGNLSPVKTPAAALKGFSNSNQSASATQLPRARLLPPRMSRRSVDSNIKSSGRKGGSKEVTQVKQKLPMKKSDEPGEERRLNKPTNFKQPKREIPDDATSIDERAELLNGKLSDMREQSPPDLELAKMLVMDTPAHDRSPVARNRNVRDLCSSDGGDDLPKRVKNKNKARMSTFEPIEDIESEDFKARRKKMDDKFGIKPQHRHS